MNHQILDSFLRRSIFNSIELPEEKVPITRSFNNKVLGWAKLRKSGYKVLADIKMNTGESYKESFLCRFFNWVF